MKKRITKPICILLALLMMMSIFSGCASTQQTAAAPTDTQAAQGSAAPQAQEEDAEAADDEMSLAERNEAEEAQFRANMQKEWKASWEDSEVTTKTVTSYMLKPEDSSQVELAFLDAYADVPFMELEQFVTKMLPDIYHKMVEDPGYEIKMEVEGNVATLTRDNGVQAILDFNENSIYFDNPSKFTADSYKVTSIDQLAATGFNSDGEPEYFQRTGVSFERIGAPTVIDMDARLLPMVCRDGKMYLPLQTLNDLFLAREAVSMLYNREELFVIASANLGALEEKYYAVEPGPRSQEMADFNFRELCLALDMNYGLKEAHHIENFEELFITTGLYEDMLSTDPKVATRALVKLSLGYLADRHTGVTKPSHYVGTDDPTIIGITNASDASWDIIDAVLNQQRYAAARQTAYPDGMPGYEEIGNTAYVTFDAFTMPPEGTDYYAAPPATAPADTMGLVIYAHSRIMREGSPIENVVVDLSNNGGGAADAAIYVLGWMLGTCNLNFEDTINNGQSSTQYRVDVNLDRVFDASDDISHLNLYCITSPNSFSCGNLVPAMLKSSGIVTLMGKPSGGGACVVMQTVTADGTIFNYSSNRRLSTSTNGAYTDIDAGVEPDIPLTKLANFYDRQALTDYINSLL